MSRPDSSRADALHESDSLRAAMHFAFHSSALFAASRAFFCRLRSSSDSGGLLEILLATRSAIACADAPVAAAEPFEPMAVAAAGCE